MESRLTRIVTFFLLLTPVFAGADSNEKVTIIDARHYSHVFAEMRNYRIFLPPGYGTEPGKKYPVIYFLHGWSQRFFGSGPDPYSEYDQGDHANGDNIEQFVLHHEVIVVKSDGYNRDKDEDYYLRPYNIGPVETHRQFPIYYKELVDHIDQTYATLADREHRAISGLSMGGFMSFFIGGKYPHLFSAVGSFCGSPEFVIGPKEMPVEYRHMDMYQNYGGSNVRLHYGDQDFIRGYHEDLNRVWTQTMDHYSFKIFPGDEHTTSGLVEMFSFLFETFKDPPQKPAKWDHIDVYPAFSVWDYEITTDRNIPGFTILENVNEKGFTSTVREFLPDGSTLPHVNLTLLTPALYKKNQSYVINDFNADKGNATQTRIKSDHLGRLKINTTGANHQIGISEEQDNANISVPSFTINNMSWATPHRDVSLSLDLLNKGMAASGKIKLELSTLNKQVIISTAESSCLSTGVNEMQRCQTPFIFQVQADEVEVVKFRVKIDNGVNNWEQDIVVPITANLSPVPEYVIADGGIYTVAKGGNDLDTVEIGQGNADGIPNPGEFIEILVKDNDMYWRTEVSVHGPYVNPFGIHLRKSDNWGSYDHVGGSAKNSIMVIASDCPENYKMDLALEYWLPNKPLHIIKRGSLSIEIEGSDKTAPQIGWIQIPANNVLQVKLYDGSVIESVHATFIDKDKNTFDFILNDQGIDGDSVESDNVFCALVPKQKFGFYRLILEATDSFGNKVKQEVSDKFLLH